MTLMEPPRKEPKLLADAAMPVPRIVNGLTVRPRERVNVWLWVVLLMPDIMALFVLVAIGRQFVPAPHSERRTANRYRCKIVEADRPPAGYLWRQIAELQNMGVVRVIIAAYRQLELARAVLW